MLYVVRELGHKRQMPSLSRGTIGGRRQSAAQRLVVREDVEGSTFNIMSKVRDGSENGEKFSVECRIFRLGECEFL